MTRLRVLRVVVALGALAVWGALGFGCAEGVGLDDGGATDDDGTVPEAGYAFRSPLQLAAVPEGVSVSLTLNHAQLISQDKAQDDGDDLRVFYEGDEGLVEIDRMLDPASKWAALNTTIWFAIQPGDGAYYLYYGDETAETPEVDPQAIFLLYEDFEGGVVDSDWSFDAIGVGATAAQSDAIGGLLQLGATGQGLGGTEDSIAFFNRSLSGDFAMDLELSAESSNGASAVLGGIIIRESVEPGARFAGLVLSNQPRSYLNVRRATPLAAVESDESSAGAEFPYFMRLRRFAGNTTVQSSTDGLIFSNIGTSVSAGLADPVLLGIPMSNQSAAPGILRFEWLRIRRAISPPPVLTVGDEETL